MRLLALVTARGGSKGFPGKNLAPLAGRPLVAWAHRALAGFRAAHPELEVELRLSTDSAAIAACWPDEDRPTELRPAELARDDTTSLDVVLHELDRCAARGRACDAVLLLQPTSPLIGVDEVDAAWRAYLAGARSVLLVAPYDHPLQWALRLDDRGVIGAAVPDAEHSRRQDLAESWRPAGLWLSEAATLRRTRLFAIPGATVGVRIAAWRAVDIDHAVDLDVAQAQLARARGERPFALGPKRVGGDAPCFVVAEAGVNHNGDVARARELIAAAAEAGADAVKFQTFRAADLVTGSARKAVYQEAGTIAGESQLAMLRRLEFPPEVFRELKAEAERRGLVFLSTPFDAASADLLAELGVVGFKLGSGELTNLPYLARIARFGRPILLSTGMATLDEVEDACAVIAANGAPPVAAMHCVSSYPTPCEQSNLRAMDSLRVAVGGPVGMSDHSLGWEVALAAVARGAKVLEKHLTLDRALPGPDHASSLIPTELAAMMVALRRVESALGDGAKRPAPCEMDTRAVARRSLVCVRDLPAGARLTADDLAIKRPASGIEPRHYAAVVGRALVRAARADEPLTWDHLRGAAGGAAS